MKAQKVSAIIHLSKIGANNSARCGKFIRPDRQELHLYLGRRLTIEEFNTHFPAAVREMAHTHYQVLAKVFVEDDPEAPEMVAVDLVQAQVDTFTQECNAKLEAAQAEKAVLEGQVTELQAAVQALTPKPKPEAGAEEAKPAETEKAPATAPADAAGTEAEKATDPESPKDKGGSKKKK